VEHSRVFLKSFPHCGYGSFTFLILPWPTVRVFHAGHMGTRKVNRDRAQTTLPLFHRTAVSVSDPSCFFLLGTAPQNANCLSRPDWFDSGPFWHLLTSAQLRNSLKLSFRLFMRILVRDIRTYEWYVVDIESLRIRIPSMLFFAAWRRADLYPRTFKAVFYGADIIPTYLRIILVHEL